MASHPPPRLSLDRVVTYRIEIPGHLELILAPWADMLTVAFLIGTGGRPFSRLEGKFDQAGLHGLLKRLYSLSVPLISVQWIEEDRER